MRRMALMVFASVLLFSAGAAAQDLNLAIAPSTPAAGAAADPPARFSSGVDYPLRLALSYEFSDFSSHNGIPSYHNNGIDTDFTGYLGHDFALEADVATGFGVTSIPDLQAGSGGTEKINADDIFYGGGLRIGPQRGRFQWFGHALIGGERAQFTQSSPTVGHLNGLAYKLGLGADIRLGPRVYWRVEGDYLGTRLDSAYQTNFQFGTGLAFTF
jgi:hypothetical protein